ncbi:MAG: hypothetical protein ABI619_12405, partial [Betaproteobacteria bacterium]
EAAVDAGRKLSIAVNHALRPFQPAQVSVGVAWFGEVDLSFLEMLQAADELMYEVKESGKGAMRSRRVAAMNRAASVPHNHSLPNSNRAPNRGHPSE